MLGCMLRTSTLHGIYMRDAVFNIIQELSNLFGTIFHSLELSLVIVHDDQSEKIKLGFLKEILKTVSNKIEFGSYQRSLRPRNQS